MKIRNNNKKIIKKLAKASYHSNKSRNRLMIAAIAMTVVVIFCICSVMKGRIDAEYLMEVRHNGNNANTSLENPTEEQISKIKNLPYVENVGEIKYFANAGVDNADGFVCLTADKTAYEDIYLPAYTDVHGAYPAKKNEVMIAIRGLEEIGIRHPELGMDITVEISTDSNQSVVQTFVLSGYYTEYVHPIEGAAIGFFSEEYLDTLNLHMENPTKLLIQQKDFLAGETIEKKLYDDVETKDEVQRFESENSVNYNVIQRTVGGYDIAFVGIMVILACVFFLNYNVMNISINRDMQYYGLLKTIGATDRQIRATVFGQTIKMAVFGCLVGAGTASVIVGWILPKVLSDFYLNNYGVSSQMVKFQPGLLVVSVCIAVLLALISTLVPAWRAGHIAPVETVKYAEVGKPQKKENQTKKRKNSIARMAWKNVIRNRQSMVLTTLSLFTGLSVALASVMITKGMDITNNFSLFPDFYFSTVYTPFEEDFDKDAMPITHEDVEYLKSLDGVTKMEVTYSDFICVSPDDSLWMTYLEGYKNNFTNTDREQESAERMEDAKKNFYSTVLLADEDFVEKLKNYVEEKDIQIDFESFQNGEGAIGIDGVLFSDKLLQKSYENIGKTFAIKDILQKPLGNLKFAGYIDTTREGYPSLRTHLKLFGPDFIMTEAAYDKLGLVKRPCEVEMYVDAEKEPQIKMDLERFMEAKREQIPPSEQEIKLPYFSANSDSLEEAQDEIKTMRIAMYTVSSLLILLGVFNYLNAAVVGLWGRRREIAIMETIGITRKQLRKMLVLEGIYYSMIVAGLVVSLGSGLLYGIFNLVHSRVRYAKFYFPYVPMGLVLAVMILGCIGVPLILYRKIADESVIERLRISGE